MTKNSDDYDKTHMKMKLDLDDELSLNKIPSMIIVVRAVFHEVTNIIHKFFR